MRRLTDAALLLLALAPPAWVFFPITRNYFQYDDFLHLYRIVNESWLRFLLTMHGGHLLITRNAVFLFCHQLFGATPSGYLWVALVTHLVNVVLLFCIIRGLTGSARLACFGSALWGILPVHQGVLGWYSAYAHVLATTFTLLVLAAIVRAARGRPPHPLAALVWVVLLLAAATSFGVGIGAVAAMPIAALLLLPASPARRRAVLVLGALALAMPLVYVGFERLFEHVYGERSAATLLVAFYRWSRHVTLGVGLLSFGILSVVLGVFSQVLAYPGVASSTIVAAYAVILIAVLLTGTPQLRRRIIACLAIGAAAYAVIAAGRMLFVTGASYASVARVPRYHYLGTAALTLVTCLLLDAIGRRFRLPAWAASALLLAWFGVTVIGYRTIGPPIAHFDGARQEVRWVLDQVELATHAAPEGSDVYIENRVFESMRLDRMEGFPGWAAVFTIYFPQNVVAGRQIHFVEPDLLVIESTRDGRRTAGLLVAPEDAPADVFRPADQPTLRRRARREQTQRDAAEPQPAAPPSDADEGSLRR